MRDFVISSEREVRKTTAGSGKRAREEIDRWMTNDSPLALAVREESDVHETIRPSAFRLSSVRSSWYAPAVVENALLGTALRRLLLLLLFDLGALRLDLSGTCERSVN
jgi:hypothetical protein